MFSELFKNSNVSEDACVMCGKSLKFKAPCCSDKHAYLVCSCGYKKVIEGWKVEDYPVHSGSGGPDAAGV